LGSILSALLSEVDLMPSGAQAVIANTSELILNQGQQSALASSIRVGRRTFSGTPLETSERVVEKGATTLTVHSAFNISTDSPQDFNRQAMEVFSDNWGRYLQSMLVARST